MQPGFPLQGAPRLAAYLQVAEEVKKQPTYYSFCHVHNSMKYWHCCIVYSTSNKTAPLGCWHLSDFWLSQQPTKEWNSKVEMQ